MTKMNSTMPLTFWQKRDLAKIELERGLRQHLLDQFAGQSVFVLREMSEDIRTGNKDWVRELLRSYDCEDFSVKWTVFFSYEDDTAGVPKITDFTIMVES